MDAFAADDAATAFSCAAPGIQHLFATPGNSMTMVQSAYAAVWRPASVAFRRSECAEDDLIQAVQMPDANGSIRRVL